MERARDDQLRASLRTIAWVRVVAVPFALLQVLTYYMPYPGNMFRVALGVTGALALSAVAIGLLLRRAQSHRQLQILSLLSFAADFAVILGLVVVYSFDQNTAMFALTYILPLEGAVFWHLRGAVTATTLTIVAYITREVWAHLHYGYPVLASSITFRMGIGIMIAVVVGAMALRSEHEHERVLRLLDNERAAADALRDADAIRDTFLSAVSHELRTPLTSVLGFALTLQHSADELQLSHREMLDVIVEQSAELDRLLADLLDIHRLMRGELAAEQVQIDIDAMVRRITESVALREDREVDLDCRAVARASVDPRMLERIVDNLVRNAVKYTPRGTRICVRTELTRDVLLIVVEDDGPGIPADLRETIFEPFRRGVMVSAHAPGTGIGLSLVQRYAQAHGGAAWVQPSASGGAAFHVRLRTVSPAAAAAGDPAVPI